MVNNSAPEMTTKTDRLINLLAFGMIITVLPAVLRVGIEQHNLFMALIEWFVYIGSVIAGFGLILRVEWVPSFAIRILGLTFGWIIYQVIFYIGQQYSSAVSLFSRAHQVSEQGAAQVLLMILIGYLAWPVIGISILTHPGIKQKFS